MFNFYKLLDSKLLIPCIYRVPAKYFGTTKCFRCEELSITKKDERSVSTVDNIPFKQKSTFLKPQARFTLLPNKDDVAVPVTISNVDGLLKQDDDLIENDTFLLPSEKVRKKCSKLKDRIYYAVDFDTLFYIFKNYSSSFEHSHYRILLLRLIQLGRQSSDSSIMDLHNKPAFLDICYSLWKMTPQLDNKTLINIFGYLQELKLDGNSLLIQSQMMAIKHKINSFELEDVVFLHSTLKKFSESPLRDVLIKAMPLILSIIIEERTENCSRLSVFEIAYMIGMCIEGNRRNFQPLLNALYYTSLPRHLAKTDLSETDRIYPLTLLINNLAKIPDSEIRYMDNKDIVVCLADKCFDELMQNKLEHINSMQTVRLGDNYRSLYQSRNTSIDRIRFNLIVSEKALQKDWILKHLLYLVLLQASMHYMNETLVKFVSNSIAKLPDYSFHSLKLFKFISVLSATDINTEEKHHFIRRCMKEEIFSDVQKYIHVSWMDVLLQLISMDFIPKDLFQNILNEEFLDIYLKQCIIRNRELSKLVIINKMLKARNLKFSIPCQLLEEAKSIPKKKLLFFYQIRDVLGGECYRLIRYCPLDDLCIDYVFCTDKFGNLLDLTGYKKDDSLGELFDREQIKKYAIMELSESSYFEPNKELKAMTKLKFDILRREGFIVIPIYRENLSKLNKSGVISSIKNKLNVINFYQ